MLYMNYLIEPSPQLYEVCTTLHSHFTDEQTKARKLAQGYKVSKWQSPARFQSSGAYILLYFAFSCFASSREHQRCSKSQGEMLSGELLGIPCP